MFSFLNTQGKQILTGNVLFILCCVFYLAWWLLAFKPSGAIAGMKTGWLLIPAALFGLLGVVRWRFGAFPQKIRAPCYSAAGIYCGEESSFLSCCWLLRRCS